jgi:hypothetical protein
MYLGVMYYKNVLVITKYIYTNYNSYILVKELYMNVFHKKLGVNGWVKLIGKVFPDFFK